MSGALTTLTTPLPAGTASTHVQQEFVTLRLGSQLFGISVLAVQDVMRHQHIAPVPLAPHMYIVQSATTKQWIIKCDCGHEFCDYRENWKLHASIYVRDTEEAMTEVYPKLMAPDTQWQVYREYYCPTCGTLHDVEAPTPWYPVIHDFEPDIEAFYKEWVHLPVPERAD